MEEMCTPARKMEVFILKYFDTRQQSAPEASAFYTFLPKCPKSFKGTRCLESDELVFKKRFEPFVLKCIWLERRFESRI